MSQLKNSNFSFFFSEKLDYIAAAEFCGILQAFQASRGSMKSLFGMGWIGLLCVLCCGYVAVGGPAANDAPRLFQSSAAVLADARRRATANDPSIAPAVRTLRADADAALGDGPYS